MSSNDTAARTETRYRFTGSAGTIWLGLRPLPLAVLAVTLCVVVGCLYLGAPLALVPVLAVLGVLAALTPIAGRVAADWTAPLSRHAAATALASRDFSAGLCWVRTAGAHHRCEPVRLPREYGKLRVRDIGDGALGVIEDAAAHAVTAVLAVAGTDRFALLDSDERNARLTGWGAALAALSADPAVRRVQWVERAGPEQRDRSSWLTERAGLVTLAEAVEDYTAMATGLATGATRHEAWLAVQLDQRATRGDGPSDAGGDAVAERVRDIASTLLSADLLARPLPTADIAWLLRRFTDHTAADHHLASTVTAPVGGPSSRRTQWTELVTDDTHHRSFAVTGWPRVPVTAGWLEPLLATSSPHAVRTVSVHLQPVPAAAAARETRAARTRARLDGAERERLGFTDSTATAWAEADAAGAEEELIAGYRMHRVSAVLTCSAASTAALAESCRAVKAAATAARVDLRPLHGQHDLGFFATLPLCRASAGTR